MAKGTMRSIIRHTASQLRNSRLFYESDTYKLENLFMSYLGSVIKRASLIVILQTAIAFIAVAQPYDPSLYSALHWRMLGPFRAIRVNAVSAVVRQPETFH